jgi:hypothetical protein
LKTSSDRVFDIFEGFFSCLTLANTTRNTEALDNPNPIFIPIERYIEFYTLLLAGEP